MSLTPEQKQLVRSTWALVRPIQEEAARLFYGRLFEVDPSTRHLFVHSDMARQGRMLMQTINIAVTSLDRLEKILPAIEDLGRRHAGYGVTDEHYASVGEALLWTLGQGLGEAFTPEVEEAWAETYWTLATIMKGAMAEAA
jgi:hemoglobin-like flavoprotein